MSSIALQTTSLPIEYPDEDGLPMAENTLQFSVIVAIKENLEVLFQHDPLVFVAGDLLWYPREGDNKYRAAPDAMVVFGVPKGHRGSYRQWTDKGIAPQVVFEVLSPGNRAGEMSEKFTFYEVNGVDEYYVFDPDEGLWEGWLRRDDKFTEIPTMHNWQSPRLGIRFSSVHGEPVTLFNPDGSRFLSTIEFSNKCVELRSRCDEAEDAIELERLAREQASQRANREAERAAAAEKKAKADTERALAAEQQAKADAERALVAEQQAKADAERALAAEQQAKADAERALVAEQQVKTEIERALAAELRAAQLEALLLKAGLLPNSTAT